MVAIRLFLLFLQLAAVASFELNILHTNDIHSHFEKFNKYGGNCSEVDNAASRCFGGVARRQTVIDKTRKEYDNVILLDGGDQFQKTIWFSVYRGSATVKFMNYAKYDAMALGNHEFDNRVAGIVPFILNATFPIVSSNIDTSAEPTWPGIKHFSKSTVIKRSGKKIGVIGYTTQETTLYSFPGQTIKFLDVIEAVRLEARRLKKEGINILIALGHAGIEIDKRIATEIAEVDVVVGGHSHSFLYTGDPPTNDKAEGRYPLEIQRQDGSKAFVVQAFEFGKYMGHLTVNFDDLGNAKSGKGNPILLDASYKEDPVVKEMVLNMSDVLTETITKEVGKTLVHLDGSDICRRRDCNLGSLVAEAVLKMSQKTPDNDEWSTASASMWNSGGLRGSISKARNESITLEDIIAVLPFPNAAELVVIPGQILKEVFEWSVSNVEARDGRFLQVSGFWVRYDPSNPIGKRIIELKIMCLKCDPPKYEIVDSSKEYKVVINSYMLNGHIGYEMLKGLKERHPGENAVDLLRRFIAQESPLVTSFDDRNIPVKATKCPANSSSRHMPAGPLMILFIGMQALLHSANI